MSRAARVLGIVVEGNDDDWTVTGLTDRVLVDSVPAGRADGERARRFAGVEAGKAFLAWRAVDGVAEARRVPRRHGHFGGEPGIEDARAAWYALQCFVGCEEVPAAVLLVRDSDGKPGERRKGLEQARDDRDWPFQVLIGVAHTMRECWVLAGFEPGSKEERSTLAELRKELGFHPTIRSDRLDASSETAKKSPKRVLSRLTGGDVEREEQCWTSTDLGVLREHGAHNGLSSFLGEVEEKLTPIFAGG
jgi:hypothetical protein